MRQINTVSNYSYATIIKEQLVDVAQHFNFPDPLILKLKKIYHLLCDESLSGKMELPYGGLSRINANGIPFQWSFSFAPNAQGSVRFVCETGAPHASCYKRFEQSLSIIDNVNALLGIPSTSWFKELALPIFMPEPSQWPKHWKSALWFAVGANKKGIRYKIYMNLNAGEIRDRWLKIGRLLTVLNRLGPLQEWCDMSKNVSENSIPVGIALDVLSNGECGRIKVYFKSEKVTLDWLSRWYSSTNGAHISPIIRSLIEAYPHTDSKVYPDRSFFVSWESGINEKATLKTELAVTNFNFTEQEVVYQTYSLMDKLNLPFKEYKKLLSLIGYSEPYQYTERAHKFVGIGFENDGSFHLNTYVQPMLSQFNYVPTKEKKGTTIEWMDAALFKSKSALFRSMVDERNWEDYLLPVGKSDIWVTAFLLFQLQNVNLTPEQSILYTNAQNWLLAQAKSTGWGYNLSTPTDSDSTSLGLLSTPMPHIIAKDILTKLESHCKTEHGYSTYDPNIYKGRWSLAVDDVSPFVLLAQQKYQYKKNASIQHFIHNNQLKNGSWRSYWWTTDLYATYGYLYYFKSINEKPPRCTELISYLENYQTAGVFEKALLINCLRSIGSKKRINSLNNEVMELQKDNGLWCGDAVLSLPKDELWDPKNQIDGTTLFKDVNGYITTAMVLSALSNVQ